MNWVGYLTVKLDDLKEIDDLDSWSPYAYVRVERDMNFSYMLYSMNKYRSSKVNDTVIKKKKRRRRKKCCI